MLITDKLFKRNNSLLGFALIVKFVAVFFGLFITRWINNYIDPETLKNYNLIISYTPIILSLITFGIPILIQKNYTNIRDTEKLKDVWTTFLVIRLLSFFLGILLILITFPFARIDDLYLTILVFTSQFILITDLNYRSVCDSRDTTWKFSVTDAIGKIVLVTIVYIGIFLDFKNNLINFFIISSIFSYLLALFLDFIWNIKITRISKFNPDIFKENLRPMIYLTISTLFFFGAIDKILLDYANVGVFEINGYSNAFKIFEIAFIVPSMTIPVFASRAKKHIDTINIATDKIRVFKKWLLYSLLIGFIVSLSLFIFSKLIFKVIDPQSLYSNYSLNVIPFFCISLFSVFTSLFYYNMNIFFHKEKAETKVQLFNAIGFLLLYALLIPRFGIYGAAFGHSIIFGLDAIRRTSYFFIMFRKNKYIYE